MKQVLIYFPTRQFFNVFYYSFELINYIYIWINSRKGHFQRLTLLLLLLRLISTINLFHYRKPKEILASLQSKRIDIMHPKSFLKLFSHVKKKLTKSENLDWQITRRPKTIFQTFRYKISGRKAFETRPKLKNVKTKFLKCLKTKFERNLVGCVLNEKSFSTQQR